MTRVNYSEFLRKLQFQDCPIEKFIDLTEENILSFLRNFLRCLPKKKNLVIWGASKGGEKVLEILQKLNIKPSLFVDSDPQKHGKELAGIKILSPAVLKRDKHIVIIGSSYKSEIIPYLRRKHIFFLDLHKVSEMLEINGGIEKNFSILNDHLYELYETFCLLEDEESREIYLSHLRCLKCLFLLPKKNCKVSSYPLYFHPKVKPQEGDIIVDAGAYIGDTILNFLQQVPEIEHVYAFEPDKKNFLELKELELKYKDKITLIHAAVWNTNGILKFQSGLGLGSHISANGTQKVKAISLDDFFKDKPFPTLIKLDVEGAEEKAIEGAKNIIENCKPKLQVCLYHNPYHLFRLPLFIKEINPSYKFYVGHHHELFWELVLYCA